MAHALDVTKGLAGQVGELLAVCRFLLHTFPFLGLKRLILGVCASFYNPDGESPVFLGYLPNPTTTEGLTIEPSNWCDIKVITKGDTTTMYKVTEEAGHHIQMLPLQAVYDHAAALASGCAAKRVGRDCPAGLVTRQPRPRVASL